MTDIQQLRGLGTALITPFMPNRQIDIPALQHLIDRQIEAGVDYLVVLGTTGEAVTLTPEEKRQVAETVVERAAGRIPLVLGLGGNNTATVLKEIKEWKEWLKAHFSAILSVCPYYNKPSQEGLYQHLLLVAEGSPVPVILYNVPGRTGVNLLPQTVKRLQAASDNIIGIKEASGNIEQIEQTIRLTKQRSDFLVISGDDGITADLMDKGADGLISVAANAFPQDFRQIVHNHDHSLQEKYATMVELLFKEGNPAGIKALLNNMRLTNNVLRLPLVSVSNALQKAIHQEKLTLQNRPC
ncbi:MAG: 4-hydroxy-tetrahydrodipicolinate synthase [Paludibacteraceae bacterium]|nr:4-hydroxy-tetrahydrodipicolinate synthase [Paludibacteraceae bacterium]